MKDRIFKLLHKNESVDTKTRYKLERETKMYVFLSDTRGSDFIWRVHKNTLNIKGIHKEGLYEFDVPRAISCQEIFE